MFFEVFHDQEYGYVEYKENFHFSIKNLLDLEIDEANTFFG